MYLMQVLEFFQEPHTFREMVDRFGEEKRWLINHFSKAGVIKVVGFVRGHDRMVYAYQTTGKPYITQKTKRFYGS